MFRTLLLLIFSLSSLVASEKPVAHSAQQWIGSVVKVKIQRNDNAFEENELIQSDSGGSGFVMDEDHHIMTNHHVIKDAKKIFIIDHLNNEYPAKLIGEDEKSDIAILSAPSFNAPKLPLAKDYTLSIGEDVFVIGSPFSLGSSVTVGVISATQRTLQNYPYQLFIQTDAAINPGNSGGPLFNEHGEVIGVATMTFARSGSYTNIGFAIDIDDAMNIAQHLIHTQKIERGYLGAELLISDKVSRKLGYSYSTLITSLDSSGPAARAGLRTGDIIVGVNNERFNDHGLLHRTLFSSHPNETIDIMYIRNKQSATLKIILAAVPDKEEKTSNLGSGDKAEKIGLVVEESHTQLSIKDVYGAAKSVGITSQDIILSINGINISTIKELNTQLSKLTDTSIGIIKLQRNGQTFNVPIGSKTALQGYTTSN